MNINALGQITHNTDSFWEEYNQIMNQTNEGILYTFKNHSDELQHIAYFIDAIDSGSEEKLANGEQYLLLTLNSMSGDFQKFLEQFDVQWGSLSDYLKKNLYRKILKEFEKIPDFTDIIQEKLKFL